MREIKAVVRWERLEEVLHSLHGIDGLPGVTVSLVRGVGRSSGGRPDGGGFGDAQMAKLEIVVDDLLEDRVVDAIVHAAHTGRSGDGKIFVSPVVRVVSIRTHEEDRSAL